MTFNDLHSNRFIVIEKNKIRAFPKIFIIISLRVYVKLKTFIN